MGMTIKRDISIGLTLLVTLLGLGGCRVEPQGCQTDDECRGDRICAEGICTSPSSEDDADSSSGDVSDPTGDTRLDTGPPSDDISPPDATPPRDADPSPPDTSPDVSPDTGPDVFPDTGPDEPIVRVRPSNDINFGGMLVDDSVTLGVRISNVGDRPLRLTRYGLRDTPSSGFDADTLDPLPNVIQPGGTGSYTVTFDPSEVARYRNALVIETNAANQQRIVIELRGFADRRQSRPCLYAKPSQIDFGIVRPGGRRTERIELVNCSQNSDVTVTGLDFVDNPQGTFQFRDPISTPFTLASDESQSLDVRYQSKARREVVGRLRIESTEQSREPETVELRGSGGGCARADVQARVPGVSSDRWRSGPIPVPPSQGVELTGRESTSPSGRVTYRWRLIDQPSSSNLTLGPNDEERISFVPRVPGTYEVQLEARDAVDPQKPACSVDTVEIVRLEDDPAFRASLDWEGPHDLDLQLLRSDPEGTFSGAGTDRLTPDNRARDWGTRGQTDDVFHLGDGPADGDASEAVVLGQLEADRDYRVVVRFEEPDGLQPFRFDATTRLDFRESGGMPQAQRRFTIREQGEDWIVFEIDGRNGSTRRIDRTD